MVNPMLAGFDPSFLSPSRTRAPARGGWRERLEVFLGTNAVGDLPGLGPTPGAPDDGGLGECPGEDCNEDALFRECDALCYPCTARVCSVDSERCRVEAYSCNECESDRSALVA